jgi:hypothetical protein
MVKLTEEWKQPRSCVTERRWRKTRFGRGSAERGVGRGERLRESVVLQTQVGDLVGGYGRKAFSLGQRLYLAHPPPRACRAVVGELHEEVTFSKRLAQQGEDFARFPPEPGIS